MRTVVLMSLLIAVMPAFASDSTQLIAGRSSSVMLEGSSNFAAWRCSGASMDARMTVASSPDHINAVIDRIEDGNIGVWMADPSRARFPSPEFRLRIPVTTFVCGNRVMESDMRRALQAERHPHVKFALERVKGGIRHDLDSGIYHAVITGDLELAGVRRKLDFAVSAERLSRNRFRFRAAVPLRMSDFGITPPSALFGAIRARDELEVRFDLILEIVS